MHIQKLISACCRTGPLRPDAPSLPPAQPSVPQASDLIREMAELAKDSRVVDTAGQLFDADCIDMSPNMIFHRGFGI